MKRQGTWYVIRARTGQEAKGASAVASLGLVVWLPVKKIKTKPRHKRRLNKGYVRKYEPIFPGYFFAQVTQDDWDGLRKCADILGWLAIDGEPSPVMDDIFYPLLEDVRAGKYDEGGPASKMKAGDELEIIFGPMAGQSVRFISATEDVAKVSAPILGAVRGVSVKVDHIRKVV